MTVDPGAPDELVALERRGEFRLRILPQYGANAAQPHFGPGVRRFRERDEIFNRLANRN